MMLILDVMQKIGLILLALATMTGAAYAHPAGLSPLQEGDTVPDVRLKFQDTATPVQLSEYEGQLVILKFWTTTCVSCFADFPKMEYLQETFGDRIRVILVNVKETPTYIAERLSVRNRKLPHLPSVIGHDTLAALFPHPYAGYSVWIGAERSVELMGSSALNVNRQKIAAVLAGEKPPKLGEPRLYADLRLPLPELLGGKSSNGSQYRAEFAGHIAAFGTLGGRDLGVADSLEGTVRNTYVNYEAWQLIHDAFYPLMAGEWASLLAGPSRLPHANQFQIYSRDTSLFTFHFVPRFEQSDYLYVKSQLSYEQVLPMGTDVSVAADLMRRDLVNYYLVNGVALDTVTERIPCLEITTVEDKGYGRSAANAILTDFFQAIGLSMPYVFTDTAGTGTRDYTVPEWKEAGSKEELKAVLGTFGFRLTEGERDMPFIRLSDIP